MEASQLLANPPLAFDGFAVARVGNGEHDEPSWARYQFACRDCTGTKFRLEELLSGENAAGVDATCSQCGRGGSVFHASRDGYDGRLGHLLFLEEITERRPLRDGDNRALAETSLACEVSYSVDPKELAFTALEVGVPAQDLFDGFAVLVGGPTSHAWRYVWEYECA